LRHLTLQRRFLPVGSVSNNKIPAHLRPFRKLISRELVSRKMNEFIDSFTLISSGEIVNKMPRQL